MAVLERGVPDDALGADRAAAVPDGGDDGAAAGRAARAAVARPRRAGAQGARAPGVRARRVQGAEVAPRLSRRSARRRSWTRRSTSSRRASVFTDDDDLVFAHPTTGKPLDRSTVYKRFKRACRRAGVRVVRFHDLRHTFGTRIAASGEVSLRTLQEWMGHRDAKTTLIYADRLRRGQGGRQHDCRRGYGEPDRTQRGEATTARALSGSQVRASAGRQGPAGTSRGSGRTRAQRQLVAGSRPRLECGCAARRQRVSPSSSSQSLRAHSSRSTPFHRQRTTRRTAGQRAATPVRERRQRAVRSCAPTTSEVWP